MSAPKGFQDKVALVWAVADLLRGDFKPHEYGSVILPFVVLRRLECALEETKDQVIEKDKSIGDKIKDKESILCKVSGHTFYNTSPYNLSKILADINKVASNLNSYIHSFSPSATEVLDKYGFPEKIKRLDESGLLYLVVGKFADLDLSEKLVSNEAMGYIFEELLRKFSEMSNETAGEHYTPREVIRLMVNLLFTEDNEALTGNRPIRSIYDPACGTGGMLSIAEEHLHELNPNIVLNVFGQELNGESWAIARSDLMIKGQDPKRITQGNSLTSEDKHNGATFDYCISNPPYGDDWKKIENDIKDEHRNLGFKGRYGAGLPRIGDGSLLFVQHMIKKMKDYNLSTKEGGTRIAVILSGPAMYNGQAGSGESEIRKWIIENDLLEGVVAMPDSLFYNTGIGTYVWIITNRKSKAMQGKIKLVDGRSFGTKMRKALGEKKKEILPEAIDQITQLYAGAINNKELVKIYDNEDFAYIKMTVDFPLRLKWKISLTENASDNEALKHLIGQEFDSFSKLEKELQSLNFSKQQIKKFQRIFSVKNEDGEIIKKTNGDIEPNLDSRDFYYVQMPKGFFKVPNDQREKFVNDSCEAFMKDEILSHFPSAYFSVKNIKIGFEIPFVKLFYKFNNNLNPSDLGDKLEEIDNLLGQIKLELK